VDDLYCVVRQGPGIVEGGETFRGAGVQGGFTCIQHIDSIFKVGEELVATGAARFEAAASLKEGAHVFALFQLEGGASIKRSNGGTNTHIPYLLAHTGHTGNARLSYIGTDYRAECWNGLQMVLSSADSENTLRVKHTRSAPDRITDAHAAIQDAVKAHATLKQSLQDLANTPMARAEVRGFVCQVITDLDDVEAATEKVAASEGRQYTLYENKGNELMRLFNSGDGNLGTDRYDALNAVTQWIDHQRRRIVDYRDKAKAFESGTFGQGAKVKARARKLLTVK
jgi:phage/plasmid-like protein (TIGR03299 family)